MRIERGSLGLPVPLCRAARRSLSGGGSATRTLKIVTPSLFLLDIKLALELILLQKLLLLAVTLPISLLPLSKQEIITAVPAYSVAIPVTDGKHNSNNADITKTDRYFSVTGSWVTSHGSPLLTVLLFLRFCSSATAATAALVFPDTNGSAPGSQRPRPFLRLFTALLLIEKAIIRLRSR